MGAAPHALPAASPGQGGRRPLRNAVTHCLSVPLDQQRSSLLRPHIRENNDGGWKRMQNSQVRYSPAFLYFGGVKSRKFSAFGVTWGMQSLHLCCWGERTARKDRDDGAGILCEESWEAL